MGCPSRRGPGTRVDRRLLATGETGSRFAADSAAIARRAASTPGGSWPRRPSWPSWPWASFRCSTRSCARLSAARLAEPERPVSLGWRTTPPLWWTRACGARCSTRSCWSSWDRVQFVLGLGLALVVVDELRGKRFIIPLLMLPVMMVPVVVALGMALSGTVSSAPINHILSIILRREVDISG